MASCECCWSDASSAAFGGGLPIADLYDEALSIHEERGCVCTKTGPEGDRARAGQFWVDGRDTRHSAPDSALSDYRKAVGGGS